MGLFMEMLSVAESFGAAFVQTTLLRQVSFCLSLPLIWTLVSNILRKFSFKGLNAPVVGKSPGLLLPMWRARLRYIFHGIEMIKEGYEKVVLVTRNGSIQLLTWCTL